jgi:hypothetical protein
MLTATHYRRRPQLGQSIEPSVTVPTEVATAIDKLTAAANTLVAAVSNFKLKIEHDVILPPPSDTVARLLPVALTLAIFMTGAVMLTKKVLTADPGPVRSR